MPEQIKFGTDGWRGVIADDYTFENVRRVAHAIANYVHQNEDPAKGVLVAYDTRFGSRRFAEITAEAIASSGIGVRLAREITPTQLYGETTRRSRWSDDHFQPQSMGLERREVQGQLWRLGLSGNYWKDRSTA